MTRSTNLLRKIALIACGAFLFGCFPSQPARAQFLGYVSPQSVQQTLASGATCTGSPQVFSPQNLGQTQHFVSITAGTGITFLQAEIDGIDNNGSVFRISDALRGGTNNNVTTNASIVAYGYYPKIQVQVSCTAAGTFTLTYAGASASNGPLVGSYALGQSDKQLFTARPANANSSDTFQPPYGNTQGVLSFQYSANGPAGSSITITCGGAELTGPVIDTFNPSATTGTAVLVYTVPSANCQFVTVTYVSGGASAATFSMEYAFTPLGPPLGTAVYSPTQIGVNALTEPGAGTSALSSIIDTRGAREATLKAACTTGAYTVNVQTYADDGTTTLALITPVTAISAAANVDLYIGSESNPTANTGTVSTTALIRMPQRALAFSFTNAGGAGTCTARLFLTY